jgi:predicted RNA binding protein YcfA (HicA-like mRNA interferase family)
MSVLVRLRRLSGREVCRILEAHGFRGVRRRGGDVIMQLRVEDTTRTVPVSDHSLVSVGTLLAIIRQGCHDQSLRSNT